MLDIVFAVLFLALPVIALIILRSASAFILLMAGAVGLSGVLMQFVSLTFNPLDYRQTQIWFLVTLIVVIATGRVIRGRVTSRMRLGSLLVIIGSSGVLALTFVVTRLLAPGNPGPLTGVGYLIEHKSAEDNAKWLNTASQLATGLPIDPRTAVGGPLVLLLAVAATLVSAYSVLLYGGVNQLAVAADTLIVAEMMMVVLAPLAIAPLAEARVRWRGASGSDRRLLPWPFVLLSVGIISASVMLLLYYGHLTLQYVIIAVAVWVISFLAPVAGLPSRFIGTVVLITAAEVWFPINILASVALAALLVTTARGALRGSGEARRMNIVAFATSVVVTIVMFDFLRSSIVYALGIGVPGPGANAAGAGGGSGLISTVDVPSLPLFASPGGTEAVTQILGLLTLAAGLGCIIYFSKNARPLASTWVRTKPFLPMLALVSYAVLVTLADFWAVGTGPGYGSKKLTYAIAIPILVGSLPFALMLIDRSARRMTITRWAAVVAVIVLLVLDTFIPRALVQVKPNLWPTTNASPQPYWWPAEVRPTAEQPVAKNPVGCVYLPQGAERPSVLQDGQRAYSCTRILTGLAGQDVAAAALVKWQLDEWLQNTNNWDHYQTYFAQMSPETMALTVILLNENSEVIGLDTIGGLMQRYPAKPETTAVVASS